MPGILFVVLWSIVLSMVVLTSRVKRPVVLWGLVLLPPLCLIGLWWIPRSRSTEYVIWGPAIMALWISLISIPIRLCDIAYKWRRSTPDANRLQLVRLLRPVLVVLIMGGLVARERMVGNAFEAYTMELAQHIQRTCERQGTCPRTVEGWAVVEENPTFCASEHVITRIGRKALIRYENLIPANQFRLLVNYGDTAWLRASGGAETSLKAPQWQ